MSDLVDRLKESERERTYEKARPWRPTEENEILIGVLESMHERDTTHGSYRVANLRAENGELRAVWMFHAVLRREWGAAGPTVGDTVGIIYLGERDGSIYSYHAYRVEVERRLTPDEGADERDGLPY